MPISKRLGTARVAAYSIINRSLRFIMPAKLGALHLALDLGTICLQSNSFFFDPLTMVRTIAIEEEV